MALLSTRSLRLDSSSCAFHLRQLDVGLTSIRCCPHPLQVGGLDAEAVFSADHNGRLGVATAGSRLAQVALTGQKD